VRGREKEREELGVCKRTWSMLRVSGKEKRKERERERERVEYHVEGTVSQWSPPKHVEKGGVGSSLPY